MIIQRVKLDELSRYNTNNYPINAHPFGLSLTDDYWKEIEKTHLKQYAEFTDYQTLTLTDRTIDILKKYNKLCSIVGRLCSRAEELWSCIPELDESGLFKDCTRWFFRFSTNSPKDGEPDFPVYSEYDVLEKIVTSRRATTALKNGDNTLYFQPYDDDICPERELRVFIYRRRITAISVYSTERSEISLLTNDELEILARQISAFWTSLKVVEKLPDSYTMDICYAKGHLKLIEFNSFGYHLAASSCLFDWIDDFDVLYSSGEQIVFRVLDLTH